MKGQTLCLEPTYEGLKHCQTVRCPPSQKVRLEPTYEGLKLEIKGRGGESKPVWSLPMRD